MDERRRRLLSAALIWLFAASLVLGTAADPQTARAATPQASNESATTRANTPLSVTLHAVDDDGDTLAFNIVDPPAHGSLDDCSTGSCNYTPTPSYAGADSFTWKANDGFEDSNTATFSITVAANSPPEASNDNGTTRVNTTLPISLFASDADDDPLTISIVTGPTHGTLTSCADGSCSYTPANDYTGPDSFTWKANDGFEDSNTATFSITVAANSPPEASNDNGTTRVNTTLPISLFASDADDDPLTISIVTGPTHGTLTSCADGSCSYTPANDYTGPDSFTWKANDGFEDSNTATFSITVAANSPPEASNDNGTTRVNTTLPISLFASDADDDPLTISIVTGPTHGTLTSCADGSCSYTPANDYTGPDSFTWKANDGFEDSNTATFSITVAANSPPEASDQTRTTVEGLPVAIVLEAIDDDALTYTIVTPPAHGTLTGTAPHLTYTPGAGYTGPDSFTWRANDGQADFEPGNLLAHGRPGRPA